MLRYIISCCISTCFYLQNKWKKKVYIPAGSVLRFFLHSLYNQKMDSLGIEVNFITKLAVGFRNNHEKLKSAYKNQPKDILMLTPFCIQIWLVCFLFYYGFSLSLIHSGRCSSAAFPYQIKARVLAASIKQTKQCLRVTALSLGDVF